MNQTDQFLFDAIMLVDTYEVPDPHIDDVIVLEAQRLTEMDLEPSPESAFTDPYHPLQF